VVIGMMVMRSRGSRAVVHDARLERHEAVRAPAAGALGASGVQNYYSHTTVGTQP
jgi:hypothetical protein